MNTNKVKIIVSIRHILLLSVVLAGLLSIIATGGGGGGGGGDGDGNASVGDVGTGTGTGTLSISMGDSVGDLYQVWITIDQVSVHKSVNGDNDEDPASWEVLEEANVGTYNLLSLINGELVELVTGELEAAHYTQIRLLIGETPYNPGEGETFPEGHEPIWNEHPYANYVVIRAPEEGEDPLPEDIAEELQISSGFQTGIKLVKGFEIKGGVVTELIFDWNMDKSIIQQGNGRYRLKPTIKILEAVVASTLSGTVTDDSVEPVPLAGAKVTAFAYITDEETGEESVSTDPYASTFTDSDGAYTLILEAGTYDIIATAEGRCKDIITELEIEEATDVTVGGDFTLSDCSSTLSGTIVDGSDVSIEGAVVKAFSYINDEETGEEIVSGEAYASASTDVNGNYTLTLVKGKYDIVAAETSEGGCEATDTLDVEESANITRNFTIDCSTE